MHDIFGSCSLLAHHLGSWFKYLKGMTGFLMWSLRIFIFQYGFQKRMFTFAALKDQFNIYRNET